MEKFEVNHGRIGLMGLGGAGWLQDIRDARERERVV